MRFIAINYNFYLFYTLGIRCKIFFVKKVSLLEKNKTKHPTHRFGIWKQSELLFFRSLKLMGLKLKPPSPIALPSQLLSPVRAWYLLSTTCSPSPWLYQCFWLLEHKRTSFRPRVVRFVTFSI